MAGFEADKDTVSYTGFKGLRNTVGEESFEPGDMAAALNVDITDANRVRRRKGFTSLSGSNYHSLWSNGATALVVSGTTLYEIMPDFTTRIVRTGLTADQRMVYAALGSRVFFSNGVETGVFDDGVARSWGIEPPRQPAASARGGTLRAGRYQFAVTYLRADGQESGARKAGVIELTATGGIAFADIPVSSDPDVSHKRLYVSPVDGDQLYAVALLTNAETTAVYDRENTGSAPLQTQFLSNPPAADHLAVMGGRVLLARGKYLLYSEPFAPELFDLRRVIPMSSAITLVAPVVDGVYLGCESEIGWLPGLDPTEWKYRRLTDYGAIPGTLAYSSAADFVEGSRAEDQAMVVATQQGVCVGLPGGGLQNLTHDRFNYPAMDRGAGLVRSHGGTVQYIATLQGTERAANVAF